ncbi:MAG: hypothetical protein O2925_08520 [Actinomycetota bacterium]|jgi:hypothetical protein|nr:hypothetical protein [Actinomycetota bacterium]MDA3015001.1 hypothetical protein [Actinomycetota bacterium]MDA3028830.1 hypothetical protein [Actinomycetota bacterium]
MIGNPFTDDNWADNTVERVDRIVGVVRDRVTNNAVKAVRAVVFGLIGLLLGIALAIVGMIMVTRGLQSLVSLFTGNADIGHSRSVYVSYLIVGGLLLLGGGMCMRRRSGD